MPITDQLTNLDSVATGRLPGLWSGTQAVNGTAGDWIMSPLGSIYVRVTSGSVALYVKTTDDGDNGDWQPVTLGTALT